MRPLTKAKIHLLRAAHPARKLQPVSARKIARALAQSRQGTEAGEVMSSTIYRSFVIEYTRRGFYVPVLRFGFSTLKGAQAAIDIYWAK